MCVQSASATVAGLALDAAIALELTQALNWIAARDVPVTITAHTTLRIAATIIRDHDGPVELKDALTSTLSMLTAPRD